MQYRCNIARTYRGGYVYATARRNGGTIPQTVSITHAAERKGAGAEIARPATEEHPFSIPIEQEKFTGEPPTRTWRCFFPRLTIRCRVPSPLDRKFRRRDRLPASLLEFQSGDKNAVSRSLRPSAGQRLGRFFYSVAARARRVLLRRDNDCSAMVEIVDWGYAALMDGGSAVERRKMDTRERVV